jgi:hypothetical protein
MRKKFETSGIIELTRHYQPNTWAARFKWIPTEYPSSNEPF